MRLGEQRMLAAVLVGLAIVAWAPSAQAAWLVTEVPNPPSWVGDTEANDINSNGVVCGMGNYVVNTSSTPFRYDGTTVTELPHLVPEDPIALAWAINVHGVVCGYSHDDDGDSRACYWEGTTLHTVPFPQDANTNADLRAYDINDHGVIVGYYYNTNGEMNAYYYADGVSHGLDTALQAAGLQAPHSASAVNNRNVVCGNATDTTGVKVGFTYDIALGVATSIGRIGSADNSATDINESGQVIGRAKYAVSDPRYRVATYDGSWSFVGAAPTASQWPGGINARGRIVGRSYVSGSGYWSWYSEGPAYDAIVAFDMPGWNDIRTQNSNQADWVVGYGENSTSGGDTRGFILRPPPGDADHDGDIDLADYEQFAGCVSGPIDGAGFVPPSFDCLKTFDVDPADGDVDLADFAAFQAAFEGS